MTAGCAFLKAAKLYQGLGMQICRTLGGWLRAKRAAQGPGDTLATVEAAPERFGFPNLFQIFPSFS
jgi:hypothetical protein